MPSPLAEAEVDDESYADAFGAGSLSDGLATGVLFKDAQLTGRAVGAFRAVRRDNPEMFVSAEASEYAALSGRPLPVPEAPPPLSADEANRRYGIDGVLAFKGPVGEGEAAFKSAQARDRLFRDEVLSRGDINPLQALGASLGGGLFDPVGLPLLFAPEAFGVRAGVEGVIAARGVGVLSKSGRLANAARGAIAAGVEGVAGAAIYEVPNYGLRRYAGEDDYTLGDSLNNLLLGGLFGAGLGGLFGSLRAPEAPRPRAAPHLVDAAPEESRLAGGLLSLDALTADEPVRVGSILDAEAARAAPTPAALRALDEVAGGLDLPGRYLDTALAVTTRGEEIPVRYAIVELGDLVTSHTDDLERNPAFPPELQPRARERAGAIARNFALEAELNPKRLMRETGAESGAPIVAPDGVVESGNGRTIALRRSAASDGEAYGRYRAELEAQGFDLTGFDKPALVRVRAQPMSGEARARLARDMNADVTERLGAAEQAMADAQGLDDAILEALNSEGVAAQRDFARRFIGRVAPDQSNSLVAPDGSLSRGGRDRLDAALVARAYSDQRLVETLFEAADPTIKTIGAALREAAGSWALMRSAAARGEIPAELDLTASLRSAVDLIRWAREEGKPVHEVILDRLGQSELFGGTAISDESEAFLRLFFRDEGFRRQRSADKIAFALKDYARQAAETVPGPNLFGETADGATARQILATLSDRFARDADGVEPAGLDLQPAGGVAERPEPVVLRPQDRGGAGSEGGGQAAGAGEGIEPAPGRPDPIARDPELAALAADTEGLAALHGVELPDFPKSQKPETLAEATRAAAFCLIEGGE